MPQLFIFQGLLFIILGIPLWLGKIAPNGIYGFRTGKTLSDPRIWYAVNRVCGIDFCIAGSVIISGSLLLHIILASYDPSIVLYANFTLVIVALAVAIVHCTIVLKRF